MPVEATVLLEVLAVERRLRGRGRRRVRGSRPDRQRRQLQDRLHQLVTPGDVLLDLLLASDLVVGAAPVLLQGRPAELCVGAVLHAAVERVGALPDHAQDNDSRNSEQAEAHDEAQIHPDPPSRRLRGRLGRLVRAPALAAVLVLPDGPVVALALADILPTSLLIADCAVVAWTSRIRPELVVVARTHP